MGSKVYRTGAWVYVLGVLLIVGPAAFSYWVYTLYVHHVPWWISNSRYSRGTHLASDGEKLFWMWAPTCMPLVGLLMLATGRNSRALVEPEGLVLIDGWGREKFRARWDEVTALLTRQRAKGGVNYIVCAGNRRAGLGPYVNDGLLADIRSHVPGLVEGDADSGPTKLP